MLLGIEMALWKFVIITDPIKNVVTKSFGILGRHKDFQVLRIPYLSH